MSGYSTAIAFVAGAAIGGATAWYLTKRKYEQLVQEEIDSIKERLTAVWEPKTEEPDTDGHDDPVGEPGVDAEETLSVRDYAALLAKKRYMKPDDIENLVEAPREPRETPYVIDPEDLGEIEEYNVLSLYYYSDGVLADDDHVVIRNVEEIVGPDALDSFGEYEDDAVHVRNERLKCDYEVLKIQETYAEFLAKNPHKAEV